MKIAVSATGKELDSQIDPRFGRAKYFLIIDTDKKEIVEIIDNTSSKDAPHGAGINAASLVAQSGAKVVLTGRVGPKAFSVLNGASIKVISEMSSTVREAVDKFLSQDLVYSDGPDGDGHFGDGVKQR